LIRQELLEATQQARLLFEDCLEAIQRRRHTGCSLKLHKPTLHNFNRQFGSGTWRHHRIMTTDISLGCSGKPLEQLENSPLARDGRAEIRPTRRYRISRQSFAPFPHRSRAASPSASFSRAWRVGRSAMRRRARPEPPARLAAQAQLGLRERLLAPSLGQAGSLSDSEHGRRCS